MKTRAIGKISHDGGFPRLIKDVQATGEPIIVMKNNEPAAIVMPVTSNILAVVDVMRTFKEVMDAFTSKGLASELQIYLATQVLEGLQAKAALSLGLSDVSLDVLEKKLTESVRRAVEEVIVNQFFPQNSSEGSGSVPPMTTAGAGVSEVKQEELPLGNSSVSRKSSKVFKKKSPSSPQKRKIGTKREKSAS